MLRNIAIIICDIQTNTIKNLHKPHTVINNINLLLDSKKYINNFKIAIGYQLAPEKLGNLSNLLHLNKIDEIHTKYTYSMYDNNLENILHNNKINEVILTGMEIQWCINQTVRDLVNHNFIVNVPIDAVGNSRENNYIPFKRIQKHGGHLCLTEDFIVENLHGFFDESSKWYINYLKSKKN